MEPLSRKERERLIRKQEIMKASARLFAEKGFASTTLEEIAVNAEYGTGTIYNYFENKEQIITSIIESVFEANIAFSEKADNQARDVVEFLELYIRGAFQYFFENKEEMILMARYFITTPPDENKAIVLLRNKQESILRKRLTDGIKKKEIRNLDPEKLFFLTHSLIYPYITLLVRHNKLSSQNVDEHLSFLLDLFFNGIKKNPK